MSNMNLVFEIVDLLKAENETFPKVARLLRMLREAEPEALEAVCKAVGIGRRKAYYLVELDRSFAPLAVAPSRLARIGWTKAQLIGPHVNKANLDELLHIAEVTTASKLRAMLKGTAQATVICSVRFQLSPLQHEFLMKRLKKHGFTGRGSAITKEAALMAALRPASTG